MAEMFLRHKLKEKGIENIKVCSAGLNTYNGTPISADSKQVLINNGIDVDSNFTSSEIGLELLENSDLILTMTLDHKLQIIRYYPDYTRKVFTLSEYAEKVKQIDIVDPYGHSGQVYEDVFSHIKNMLEIIIEKLGH